jgi:hypothetical protein
VEATWPSVQPPAGDERKAALYALAGGNCKANEGLLRLDRALDNFGQPNRKLGALADSVILAAVGSG